MRNESFAQSGKISWVDKWGRFLSNRKVKKSIGTTSGKTILDIGCGYDVGISLPLLADAKAIFAVDVSVDEELTFMHPGLIRVEGYLPSILHKIPDNSIDILIANNILEHLDEPIETLKLALSKCKKDFAIFINVPSWRGKFFLELAAFKLGLAPFDEMEDHKMYYSRKELWVLLVASGLKPSQLKIRSHKFGLNTMATISRSATATSAI